MIRPDSFERTYSGRRVGINRRNRPNSAVFPQRPALGRLTYRVVETPDGARARAVERARRRGILAAIRLGINNGRMEGLNSKVRLLSHRSFGFHGPQPLIALIYLCCSGLTINPPHR